MAKSSIETQADGAEQAEEVVESQIERTGLPAAPVQPVHQPGVVDHAGASSTDDGVEALYCANHPGVETLLRCNRCGKPICLKCAELTDVGYRCKECIRGVQDVYFNAQSTDNPIAFGVAFGVTAIAAPIASILFRIFPFFWGFILAFMVGGAAGGILAQIIRAAVGRRRGRHLRYYALGGVILGVLFGSVIALFVLGISPLNLPLLVFTFLAAATAYQILR